MADKFYGLRQYAYQLRRIRRDPVRDSARTAATGIIECHRGTWHDHPVYGYLNVLKALKHQAPPQKFLIQASICFEDGQDDLDELRDVYHDEALDTSLYATAGIVIRNTGASPKEAGLTMGLLQKCIASTQRDMPE